MSQLIFISCLLLLFSSEFIESKPPQGSFTQKHGQELLEKLLPKIKASGSSFDGKFTSPMVKTWEWIQWGFTEDKLQGWDRIEVVNGSLDVKQTNWNLYSMKFELELPAPTSVIGTLSVAPGFTPPSGFPGADRNHGLQGQVDMPMTLKTNQSIPFNVHLEFNDQSEIMKVKSVSVPNEIRFSPDFQCKVSLEVCNDLKRWNTGVYLFGSGGQVVTTLYSLIDKYLVE